MSIKYQIVLLSYNYSIMYWTIIFIYLYRLRNERVALHVASARLVRPLGDQVCRPNCPPVLTQQVEQVETTQISERQTTVTIQAPAPIATMPPPPPPVSSATTMSSPTPKMDVQNNVIAPMELPVAEEMEETIFNLLGNSRTTTATQAEIPTTDVADTQLPMDSNNITPPGTQELQVL